VEVAPSGDQVDVAPPGGQVGAGSPAPGFMVSARTPTALAELAGRYGKHLAGLADADYPAFAYTATHGRTRLRHTAWVQARDAATAAAAVDALAGAAEHPAVRLLDESEPLPWSPSPAERAVTTVPGYPWQHVRHVVATGSQR
jgi:hypothetical protein